MRIVDGQLVKVVQVDEAVCVDRCDVAQDAKDDYEADAGLDGDRQEVCLDLRVDDGDDTDRNGMRVEPAVADGDLDHDGHHTDVACHAVLPCIASCEAYDFP